MPVIISDQIQIKRLAEGIALHAPSHGLQEVFLDASTLKVSRKYYPIHYFPMLYDTKEVR